MTKEKRGWKTASSEEREKAAKGRTQKGAQYINTDLAQFTPIDGSNCIRIVPPLADDAMATLWGIDVWTYYLAGKGFLSPTTFDPRAQNIVLEAYKRVKADDPEEAKRLQLGGTRKTILFILDFGDGSKEPELKVWSAPPGLVDEFIRVAKNRRTGRLGALEDPEEGYCIFFDRIGVGKKTEYKGVTLDKEPYPLDESLLDKIPYFTDILVVPDADDLKIALDDTLSGKAQESQEEHKFERRDSTKRRGHDDDDDDQPRRSKHRNEDDDDEPHSKSKRRDEDDDEPRRKHKREEDDDDEVDDQPRSKSKRQEAEDDEPQRRKPKREENDLTLEDDDRPTKKAAKDAADEDATPKLSKVDELRARLAAKTTK